MSTRRRLLLIAVAAAVLVGVGLLHIAQLEHERVPQLAGAKSTELRLTGGEVRLWDEYGHTQWWLAGPQTLQLEVRPFEFVGVDTAGVNALAAWERSRGAGVVVAVIDSGVSTQNPDLAGRLWRNPREQANGLDDDGNGIVDDLHGADFVRRSGTVEDAYGHGTEVAALIAAERNGSGIAGVAPDAQLMPLIAASSETDISAQAAVEAIRYAVAQGARVINLSWGRIGSCPATDRAIAAAVNAGAVVVMSAGNEAQSLVGKSRCPAQGRPGTIAVAALDRTGRELAYFSNHGPAVALAAPGEDITTASGQSSWHRTSGTSVAAPMVAGAAALLLSRRPQASPAAVVNALTASARPLPALQGRVRSGGMLDAAAALDAIEQADLTPPTQPRQLSPKRTFRLARPATVVFRWSQASDDRELAGYRLTIDGRTRPLPAKATRLSVRLGRGMHSWSVAAVDAAGNRSG